VKVGTVQIPGVLLRGGSSGFPFTEAGVFSLDALNDPSNSGDRLGFRCAR
jgi:hypothetical protein